MTPTKPLPKNLETFGKPFSGKKNIMCNMHMTEISDQEDLNNSGFNNLIVSSRADGMPYRHWLMAPVVKLKVSLTATVPPIASIIRLDSSHTCLGFSLLMRIILAH